jgi:hypothetical protein
MAGGDYEAALPVAVNAVKQGQAVYKPATSIQLFPLYLLAAQVRGVGEMISRFGLLELHKANALETMQVPAVLTENP